MPELRPRDWHSATPLGKGSFGVVYRATWRGHDVAVKQIKLPNTTEMARQQLKGIVDDFVSEVEVCADIHHPNDVVLHMTKRESTTESVQAANLPYQLCDSTELSVPVLVRHYRCEQNGSRPLCNACREGWSGYRRRNGTE
jgi:serine/threonine protein kinase